MRKRVLKYRVGKVTIPLPWSLSHWVWQKLLKKLSELSKFPNSTWFWISGWKRVSKSTQANQSSDRISSKLSQSRHSSYGFQTIQANSLASDSGRKCNDNFRSLLDRFRPDFGETERNRSPKRWTGPEAKEIARKETKPTENGRAQITSVPCTG